MGEIKIVERASKCEFCDKVGHLGAEVEYKGDIFWACLDCNEKIEVWREKQIDKLHPELKKAHDNNIKEIKAKIK